MRRPRYGRLLLSVGPTTAATRCGDRQRRGAELRFDELPVVSEDDDVLDAVLGLVAREVDGAGDVAERRGARAVTVAELDLDELPVDPAEQRDRIARLCAARHDGDVGGRAWCVRRCRRRLDDRFRLLTTGPRTALMDPVTAGFRRGDIAAVAAACRSRGVTSVIDSTFGTPVNQRPLALGVDIVMHSATKYLNGHGDITAGVLAGRAEAMAAARAAGSSRASSAGSVPWGSVATASSSSTTSRWWPCRAGGSSASRPSSGGTTPSAESCFPTGSSHWPRSRA